MPEVYDTDDHSENLASGDDEGYNMLPEIADHPIDKNLTYGSCQT